MRSSAGSSGAPFVCCALPTPGLFRYIFALLRVIAGAFADDPPRTDLHAGSGVAHAIKSGPLFLVGMNMPGRLTGESAALGVQSQRACKPLRKRL